MEAQRIAEKAKIQGLANADGSPTTTAQIENAMRAANNSQYDEYASTGVVVPLKADTPKSAIYDTTSMKLAIDRTGNYLVQDLSVLATPSIAMQNLITESTDGEGSPNIGASQHFGGNAKC